MIRGCRRCFSAWKLYSMIWAGSEWNRSCVHVSFDSHFDCMSSFRLRCSCCMFFISALSARRSFEHWKSTASSTLFCCLFYFVYIPCCCCFYFFFSHLWCSFCVVLISCTFWLFLLEFIRRGLLHWPVGIGRCLREYTLSTHHRSMHWATTCVEMCDDIVSARTLFIHTSCKNIDENTQCGLNVYL